MRIDKSNIRFTIATLVGLKNSSAFNKWAFGKISVDNHTLKDLTGMWNQRHSKLMIVKYEDIFSLSKMVSIWKRNIKKD